MQNYSSKFKVLLRTLLICLTFNFALLTFNLDKAEASALSLSVDPPIIEIIAIPPANLTRSITIQNKGNAQVTLQIQIKPFKANGENGEVEYVEEVPQFLKNVQILDINQSVKSITLEPKQQKKLDLNINIPQANQADGAGGRDYYFSIIFISSNTPAIETTSSINRIGVATNVLLSVGPKETPKAILEEFSSNLFFESGPVPFTIRVKNEGAHFIKPEGTITIKNVFGQSVGQLNLLSVNILSDSIRAITNKEVFPANFRRPVALWKEGFLLGFYTATLNISLSDEGPAFTRTTHFFAFPIQGLIIILVIAFAVIVAKNRLKKYLDKSSTF